MAARAEPLLPGGARTPRTMSKFNPSTTAADAPLAGTGSVLREWYAGAGSEDYAELLEEWGELPVEDGDLAAWPHLQACQACYFESHEEIRGLSHSATGTPNGLWVLRLLFVSPALLYFFGILLYFYSGLVANCFIGLERLDNYTGSRTDFRWVDGSPYDAGHDIPWIRPSAGTATNSLVTGIIGRALGASGVTDLGGVAENQFPGQPFRPLCNRLVPPSASSSTADYAYSSTAAAPNDTVGQYQLLTGQSPIDLTSHNVVASFKNARGLRRSWHRAGLSAWPGRLRRGTRDLRGAWAGLGATGQKLLPSRVGDRAPLHRDALCALLGRDPVP
eukprot:SAG22_NODE_31_length_27697_cov_7.384376_8_plen_333_part_00